jgi:hypothetical protein
LFLSIKGCFGLSNNCFWSCTVNKRGSFILNVLFTFLYLFCRRLLYFTSVSFSSALEYSADRKSPYHPTRLGWWQRCQINKWNDILKQNRPTRPWWFHKQSLLTKQGKTYLKCKSLRLVMTECVFIMSLTYTRFYVDALLLHKCRRSSRWRALPFCPRVGTGQMFASALLLSSESSQHSKIHFLVTRKAYILWQPLFINLWKRNAKESSCGPLLYMVSSAK